MPIPKVLLPALIALLSAAYGCAKPGTSGATDASFHFSGPMDAGPMDAGIDAGPMDAGIDAGPMDAGIDAGVFNGCTITDPDVDMDSDGWTPNEGDCNDCNPNINPGAIDLPAGTDGGTGIDSDCDGTFDPPEPCDTGLALDDVDALDAAKALGLCRTTTESPALAQKTWGVVSAKYVRANGDAFASPGLQTGLESGWGDNVTPQEGQNMLVLSSGHARTPAQTGACGSQTCTENANGTAPTGFPQDIPSCPPSTTINDDIGLELKIRVPTNVKGYSFRFKFYSMEYPYYVCDSYNDQFIALASPAPSGSINGNIAFDDNNYPVGVNLAFLSVCDPTQSSLFAQDCRDNESMSCPMVPDPYCPSGTDDLQGTGFDTWDTANGGAGATTWLTASAPVTGGDEVTLRFAIWDTGDSEFDSTVLIDSFRWIPTSSVGHVAVGITP